MAISILSTPAINALGYSGTFGSAGEYHVVIERQNLTSGVYRSVATAITLGGAAMTLLASMEWQGDGLIAFWGMHVTPALAGTAFSMVRTAGTYALTDRVDAVVLSGVSTDPLFAKHEYRNGVGSRTSYSHIIATDDGGMLLDYIIPVTGYAYNSGQNWLFTSLYSASKKDSPGNGTTTVGWTFSASRFVYACVSLRALRVGGGIMGIV
ncbi:MAG TPA: hypothetical protein PLO92_09470 [Anaerolineaceae bacterium]|nr:hypothetical protein [Anaerolineaceae bacterium]